MNADETKPLAAPMTFSVYPKEKDALLRLMREENLKSTFDVVRLFAAKTRLRRVQPGDFEPPKQKS